MVSPSFTTPTFSQTTSRLFGFACSGHSFQPQAGQAEHAVILSESAAKQLWPNENPVGRSIRLGAIDEGVHKPSELSADGPAYQVIGVARDTRGVEFDGSDSKQVYLPLPEDRFQNCPILIRTQSDTHS